MTVWIEFSQYVLYCSLNIVQVVLCIYFVLLKVETHAGNKGERTKYFDDDDKFDLKTMVSCQ